MKLTTEQLLAATVAYADIFKFPLTPGEVSLWILFDKTPISRSLIEKAKRAGFIQEQQRYLLMPGRTGNVAVRRRREKYASAKWAIAGRVGNWLRLAPTITLVGVTGGLALNHAEEKDDIDLFFIADKGTLWLSRFLAIVLVELLGLRRRPGDTQVKNKICLNMFMTSDAVGLPAREQDVFAAHEILQMQPLWERDNSYQKFLSANRWVEKFLPNAWKKKFKIQDSKFKIQDTLLGLVWFWRLFEPPARAIQLWYMRRHRTTEVILPGVLRFHPRDARAWVKLELERRLIRYHIPLDKVFRGR